MSDGFYSLYDSLKNKDLMDLVIKNDSDEFIHSVKKTFKKDKTFDQYQRFKLVDDISYLLLK